jgi:hypothetical protein
VYLRARYYEPTTAQFLTRDPAEALTRAPYSYADGDPVNEVDPLGLRPHITYDTANDRRISKDAAYWLHDSCYPTELVSDELSWTVSFGFGVPFIEWAATARLNEDITYEVHQVGFKYPPPPTGNGSYIQAAVPTYERTVYITYHYHSDVMLCGGDFRTGTAATLQDACPPDPNPMAHLKSVDWEVTDAYTKVD